MTNRQPSEYQEDRPLIALTGNPNTGKSTLFNSLTGLRQHTGNWPGKTVSRAVGYFEIKKEKYTLIDLPGIYSLAANSPEEEIARDFLCFNKPDAIIVIADATNLQRNLNLVLQICELRSNIILCVNLMDEAQKKDIKIDIEGLERDLGIPVIPTIARSQAGITRLKKTIYQLITGKINPNPAQINYTEEIEEYIFIIKNKLGQIPDISKILNLRWLSLRIIEGDRDIWKKLINIEDNKINLNFKEKGREKFCEFSS